MTDEDVKPASWEEIQRTIQQIAKHKRMRQMPQHWQERLEAARLDRFAP